MCVGIVDNASFTMRKCGVRHFIPYGTLLEIKQTISPLNFLGGGALLVSLGL